MRILPMTNFAEVQGIAKLLLTRALENPESSELIANLIVDPEANPATLVHTAFVMGAIAGLSEMLRGHVVPIPQPLNPKESLHSDS